jgi:hypothetical protein
MASWTVEEARDAIARRLSSSDLPITVVAVRALEEDVVIEFEVAERPGCRFALRFWAEDDGDTPSVARLADYACLELQEELEAADRGLPIAGPVK